MMGTKVPHSDFCVRSRVATVTFTLSSGSRIEAPPSDHLWWPTLLARVGTTHESRSSRVDSSPTTRLQASPRPEPAGNGLNKGRGSQNKKGALSQITPHRCRGAAQPPQMSLKRGWPESRSHWRFSSHLSSPDGRMKSVARAPSQSSSVTAGREPAMVRRHLMHVGLS